MQLEGKSTNGWKPYWYYKSKKLLVRERPHQRAKTEKTTEFTMAFRRPCESNNSYCSPLPKQRCLFSFWIVKLYFF